MNMKEKDARKLKNYPNSKIEENHKQVGSGMNNSIKNGTKNLSWTGKITKNERAIKQLSMNSNPWLLLYSNS